MNWWILIVIVLVGVVIAQAMTKKPRTSSTAEVSEETPTPAYKQQIQYKKKNFLTSSEKTFLSTLSELSQYDLTVVPQVNLATVIKKIGDFKYQSELYRNIDFGIFDKEYNLLLLVELNDPSHQQIERRKRDFKVKDIVSQAGIKLMTFYTDKPNNPDYVINRILKDLNLASKSAPQ